MIGVEFVTLVEVELGGHSDLRFEIPSGNLAEFWQGLQFVLGEDLGRVSTWEMGRKVRAILCKTGTPWSYLSGVVKE